MYIVQAGRRILVISPAPLSQHDLLQSVLRLFDHTDYDGTSQHPTILSASILKVQLVSLQNCSGMVGWMGSHWPNIRPTEVEKSPVNPKGGWYLTRYPQSDIEYDDDDEDNDQIEERHVGEASSVSACDFVNSFFERMTDHYDKEREDRIVGIQPFKAFRVWPTTDLLAIYKATARCAMHMPHLQKLRVHVTTFPCARTN